MRKALVLACRVLTGLITLAVVGVLLLAWRLEQSPLVLDRFVPVIEQALSPASGGSAIRIERLALAREGLRLFLRAENLRVTDDNGDELVMAAIAKVELSPSGFIRDGIISAESIDIEGLVITAAMKDGKVSISAVLSSIGTDQPTTAAVGTELADTTPVDLSRALAMVRDDPNLQHLKRVYLQYANISFGNEQRGMAWRAPNLALEINRNEDGLTVRGGGLIRQHMMAGVEVDKALGKVTWQAQISWPDDDIQKESEPSAVGTKAAAVPVITAAVTLDKLSPDVVSGFIPPLLGEHGLEAAISGTFSTTFRADQIPETLNFAVALGEGKISLPQAGALRFDQVAARGQVLVADRRVTLEEFALDYDDTTTGSQMRLTGEGELLSDGSIAITTDIASMAPAWLASITPEFAQLYGVKASLEGQSKWVFDTNGRLRSGNLDLRSFDAVINLPGFLEEPLPIEILTAKLRLADYGGYWDLQGIRMELPNGATAVVRGAAARGDREGKAKLRVVASGFDVETVKRAWPLTVSPPAREWIVENIRSGLIPRFEATVQVDIGKQSTPIAVSNFRVDGSMPVLDAVSTYWGPMPVATGINLEARITEKFFEATILSGLTGGMRVTGGKISITGIDKGKGHERLALEVETNGPISRLMTILDRKPLDFAKFLELAPSELEGSIGGRLAITLPPVADLQLEDITINAVGKARKAVLPNVVAGQALTEADLGLKVSKTDLTLEGTAKLGGVPVALRVHTPFGDAVPYRNKYVVSGRINNRQRRALGLTDPSLQPPFLDGSIALNTVVTERKGGITLIDADFDLSKTALLIEPIGWTKKKGAFLAGKTSLRLDGDKIRRVERLQVSGPGLQLKGSASWQGDDKRPAVNISSLKLGGGTDIGLTAKPWQKDGYQVTLGPGRLDLSEILKRTAAARPGRNAGADKLFKPPGPTANAIRVNLSGPSIKVRSGPPIDNVRGFLLLADGNVMDADVSGSPGGVGQARFRLDPNGHLQVESDDAGALIASLGIPGRITGGTFTLDGDATPDFSSVNAEAHVRDFTLLEAPVIIRVLQLASITGPLELLNDKAGLQMTGLDAPFQLHRKKLTIKEGWVYGGSLGITFRGDVDLPTQKMDLRGAVVPIYVFNRLLSSVPIVGDILTGGDGLFAVSYTVKGPLSDPKIKVNPLSLLVPGGLRRLLLD
jgi:hypothetical protein